MTPPAKPTGDPEVRPAEQPLAGRTVLVPRGGAWGDDIAERLRARGATPVIAPLITFRPASDDGALRDALARLSGEAYDWLTITSATTVEVLLRHQVSIPQGTKVAAVGPATAETLIAAGYTVQYVPEQDWSARGLLEGWEGAAGAATGLSVLVLGSAIAQPTLASGLAVRGHRVDAVAAYRTIGVPAPETLRRDVNAGRVDAILVTSGSVARQVQNQFSARPDACLIVAIGPQTVADAERIGLSVHQVAAERSVESLIEALVAGFGGQARIVG